MPRAVLDTNVLVAALITPAGTSARLLDELRAGAFELVVSPQLLTELDDVLARPKLRRYVTQAQAEAYVALIKRAAIVLPDPTPSGTGPYPGDPDDHYLIELARSGQVHALVSGDAQVLDLAPTVPVMTPSEFLSTLSG